MAETLLSFGVQKLWDLLGRESERFKGVEEQFNELKSDLEKLRCFLKDANAKKHTSAVVRNTLKEIKDIVYDAEDIIETFLRKEELRKTSGIKKRITRLACVIADRREVAFDMEVISKRISKVMHDMVALNVTEIVMNDAYTLSLQERQREMRQAYANVNEGAIVGMFNNAKKLVDYLVKKDSSQVVSITGMGGLGKTTMARIIFRDQMIKSKFAGLAWVCVSKQFTRKYVWETILRKLKPEYKVLEMTEDELQEKLFQVLEKQEALIVLDDIWGEEAWDIIKPIFPQKKGWKVLLTSRNEGVGLRADPSCFTFRPDFLNPEESWTLFLEIAFPRRNTTDYKVDEEMEEMGKQMFQHCGGLPLAVKVLAGLLAAKYTLHEWKKIYENIGGAIFNDRNMNSVYHVLYLSYEELPSYLKHCFLYLSHFPEDESIDVDTLSYYWAAEGIPRPRHYDGATIQEVANGYIEELVKRNMVMAERNTGTSRIETCQLHDMMREVCLLKAEEENFVQIVDASTMTSTENSQSPCKSRRLVVHSSLAVPSSDRTYHMEGGIKNPKLRSLLFIKQYPLIGWKASGLCFTRLQLMRVLDLSKAEFKGGKLPSSIGLLIHLKYLSLYHAKVSHLPSSMRDLKLLLYLDLCVALESTIYIPKFLKEFQELRYLSLPAGQMHDKTKLELGNLINLDTFKNFSTKHCTVADLHQMKRLKTLSILFSSKGCTMETLSSSLGILKYLENLSIGGQSGQAVRCSNIIGTPMNERRMLCSTFEFPKLENLELYGLDEWEEWILEEGSMPRLHALSIHSCPNLKMLPYGLKYLEHLKETTIITTNREFKENLSRGGKDYHKVSHIPVLEILYLP